MEGNVNYEFIWSGGVQIPHSASVVCKGPAHRVMFYITPTPDNQAYNVFVFVDGCVSPLFGYNTEIVPVYAGEPDDTEATKTKCAIESVVAFLMEFARGITNG